MSEEPVEWVELTKSEFNALPEYSCSLPSTTTIGKTWRCNRDVYSPRANISATEEKITGRLNNWWMGTYYELIPANPNRVGIKWQKIRLKETTCPTAD